MIMRQTPEQLKLYKRKICEIAKASDAFCTQHNLRYFGIGGTAIGALRHKGIIPWDDDIDFVMPRPDYERFLQLSEALLPKYEVFTHRNTPKYHLTMAKMCDANTSYIGSFQQRVVLGAFIDIFPIDGCPGATKRERERFFNDYLELRHDGEAIGNYYSLRDFLGCVYHLDWKGARRQLRSHLYHWLNRDNDIFKRCDEILMSHPYESSDYVAYFSTWRSAKIISPKKWFDGYYYAPFEDFEIRLPIGIHEYLTQLFGDYMTPPPPEVIAVDDHGFAYMNLEKRVSLEEAIREIH